MNCRNCGAPMKLLREQQYFYCEHCASYHFPAPEDGKIRKLGPSPDAARCPTCLSPLQLASYADRHSIRYCSTCRGMLFARRGFGETIEKERAWTESPPDPPKPLDRAELQRHVTCPLCGNLMQTYPYLGPGNIVIDTCDACDVVWLDHGELQRAVNAPGRDRGAATLKRERERARWESLTREENKERRDGRIDLTELLDFLFD